LQRKVGCNPRGVVQGDPPEEDATEVDRDQHKEQDHRQDPSAEFDQALAARSRFVLSGLRRDGKRISTPRD
jgi:hypothetical protein